MKHALICQCYRLTPKNAHQRPNVVVLCGPHFQGAYGVNTARQLATHNVNVTVFVPNLAKVLPILQEELNLFDLTDGKKSNSAKGKYAFGSVSFLKHLLMLHSSNV